MRNDNVKPGEFLSPLLSAAASRVAKFLLNRHAPPAKYKRVCEMARHKYPYRGPLPAWVFAGSLD